MRRSWCLFSSALSAFCTGSFMQGSSWLMTKLPETTTLKEALFFIWSLLWGAVVSNKKTLMVEMVLGRLVAGVIVFAAYAIYIQILKKHKCTLELNDFDIGMMKNVSQWNYHIVYLYFFQGSFWRLWIGNLGYLSPARIWDQNLLLQQYLGHSIHGIISSNIIIKALLQPFLVRDMNFVFLFQSIMGQILIVCTQSVS